MTIKERLEQLLDVLKIDGYTDQEIKNLLETYLSENKGSVNASYNTGCNSMELKAPLKQSVDCSETMNHCDN